MIFITKKRVAKEIAKLYKETEVTANDFYEAKIGKWEVASNLNVLCTRLGITPLHLNKLGGGNKTFKSKNERK